MINLSTSEVTTILTKTIEKNATPRETKVMSKVLQLATEFPQGLGLVGKDDNILLVSPHVDSSEDKAVLATEKGIFILKQKVLEAGALNYDRMVDTICGAIDEAKETVSIIQPDDFETRFPSEANGLFIESMTQVNLDDPDSDAYQEMVRLCKKNSETRAYFDAQNKVTEPEVSSPRESQTEVLAKKLIKAHTDLGQEVPANNYSWVASTDRRHPGLFEPYSDYNRTLTNAIRTVGVDQEGNSLWIVNGVLAVVNYPGEISRAGDTGLDLSIALGTAAGSEDKHYEGQLNGRNLVINICELEKPTQVPEKLIQSLLSVRAES